MISIFTDKSIIPAQNDLKPALGNTYLFWKTIEEFTRSEFPDAKGEWNYPGAKYGWSYRIKDKKRAIVYLLPRDKFFKTAMVFGNKAYEKIQESEIAEFIKTELKSAKAYAEGRGIRIDVKEKSILDDIKKLIKIKISY